MRLIYYIPWLRGHIKRAVSRESKVRYGTRASADRACAEMLKKRGAVLESYKCQYCKGFHIGHGR